MAKFGGFVIIRSAAHGQSDIQSTSFCATEREKGETADTARTSFGVRKERMYTRTPCSPLLQKSELADDGGASAEEEEEAPADGDGDAIGGRRQCMGGRKLGRGCEVIVAVTARFSRQNAED